VKAWITLEISMRLKAKGADILGGAPMVVDQQRFCIVRDRGGSIAGSPTCGAGWLTQFRQGLGADGDPLPGNGAMRLTTARYYTPSGRSIRGSASA
jgi:carboxyl-terminal processing protease